MMDNHSNAGPKDMAEDRMMGGSSKTDADDLSQSGVYRGDSERRAEGRPQRSRVGLIIEGEELYPPVRGTSTTTYSDIVRSARKEVDTLRRELEGLGKEYDKKSEERSVVKREKVDEIQRQEAKLGRKIEAAQQQAKESDIRLQQVTQELRTVKEQLRHAEAIYFQTRDQLAERTSELQSVQSFISQADALSGADVVNMAAALNAEIHQCAALMADSLQRTPGQEALPHELLSAVESRIGKDMLNALRAQRSSTEIDYDPTHVQLALQICFVSCCRCIIKSWTLGYDTSGDRLLWHLYDKIWAKGQ
ncbi:hypothetical protein H0H87_010816 [Tephrocybe sp. NHM501043]|nr:hypothetical protein H0H87_010816 [Tephrocybe sp. NHM501043]